MNAPAQQPDATQPLAERRRLMAGRVAYLEREVAELEQQMKILKRDLSLRTWELGEAIIAQAALARQC